jgi:hypothetical protein
LGKFWQAQVIGICSGHIFGNPGLVSGPSLKVDNL